jgi:pilus assembly protein CpaD
MTFRNEKFAASAWVVFSKASTLVASSAIALALAGCRPDDTGTKVAGWALVDPTQRHPIIVSQEPQTLTFNVPKGSQGLSPQQRAQLLGFAASSRASDAGNSRLVIEAPAGSANEAAAIQSVQQIRQLLSDNGFSESSISVEPYSGEGSHPPIRVSYLRFVAEGPECGHWTTNLARDPYNLPNPNIGCANQRNLAAMVANPADLLGPRTMSDRSGERRDVTWNK